MKSITLNIKNHKTEQLLLNLSRKKNKPVDNVAAEIIELYINLYYEADNTNNNIIEPFEPEAYYGMIQENFDIEEDLLKMKEEWKRNF